MSDRSGLVRAIAEQRDRLLPCVHCGFCLPACPTYARLGDEADSPRGRLHLMQAVVDGRLDPASDAFRTHIDRCLGCRACEPVCPSGVEYGILLEHARETSSAATPPGLATRALLTVMGSPTLRRVFFLCGRILRATGVAALGVRLLPSTRRTDGARLALAMLASTRRWRPDGGRAAGSGGDRRTSRDRDEPILRPVTRAPSGAKGTVGGRVGILTGCVQEGLYRRVNDATERVLRVQGYEVVRVRGQDCCGALHAHAGALERARDLARRNIAAFEEAELDAVVVNAAGCGAAMKQYGVLLEHDGAYAARAAGFSARVRDLMEILAEVGPRRGAEVRCSVAYDHPCHLLHAQGIRKAPLEVLDAVPGVEVTIVENADECCGGAGIYGITHPDLGGRIGRDKIRAVRDAGGDTFATPNPGCMMQIGAGLRLEGSRADVVHPVEILDESYRRAGYYA